MESVVKGSAEAWCDPHPFGVAYVYSNEDDAVISVPSIMSFSFWLGDPLRSTHPQASECVAV